MDVTTKLAFQPMHILVTGGCGFVGSNLVPMLLAEGHRVRVLDNLSVGSATALADLEVDLHIGDVRDKEAVARVMQDIEGVVHLAAQTGVIPSVEDPRLDYEINVGGTLNLLQAAVAQGVKRFVFASSNAPLGEQPPPVDETRPPRPLSPYGASKLAGEGYCSAFNGSFGLGTVVLRFANLYGPRSTHKSSVVAKFIRRIQNNEPLIIYGDGRQTRDFIHVADLGQAIRLALQADLSGELFQIATGRETSVLELVEILKAAFSDQEIEVQFAAARPGEIIRNYSNIDRARRLLGFAPTVDLKQGITETCAWFARQKR